MGRDNSWGKGTRMAWLWPSCFDGETVSQKLGPQNRVPEADATTVPKASAFCCFTLISHDTSADILGTMKVSSPFRSDIVNEYSWRCTARRTLMAGKQSTPGAGGGRLNSIFEKPIVPQKKEKYYRLARSQLRRLEWC